MGQESVKYITLAYAVLWIMRIWICTYSMEKNKAGKGIGRTGGTI